MKTTACAFKNHPFSLVGASPRAPTLRIYACKHMSGLTHANAVCLPLHARGRRNGAGARRSVSSTRVSNSASRVGAVTASRKPARRQSSSELRS
eukprot:2807892-Pleurochrysis_carterae.AAC.8